MDFVLNFPFFSIILSMFMGVLCAILPGKAARWLAVSTVFVILCMSTALMLYTLNTGESYVYMMGHFPAPFGNEIRFGVLESVMAFVFSGVMLLSLCGGMKHIFHDVEEKKVNHYFLMINLLFSSMLALIYTNDLFTAYVFIEINTITSCAIVMLKRSKETLVATARYLIMSLLGSGLFFVGICILYDITGHLLMSNIKEAVAYIFATGEYMFPLEMVVCLFGISLAIKAALFPFHTWLPDAHGSTTSSSSSILSGLVLKAYIILLIKIFFRVIGIDVIYDLRAVNIFWVLGLIAMTIGSIKAIQEKDIKRMVAYSSVAQIGYIFMGIGLGSELGLVAACLHIIVHAVTKPMLFSAAGGFMEVSGGSKRFSDIAGAGRRNLLAGIAFTVGSLSMIGIPLTAGFTTKVYFSLAAMDMPVKMWITLACLAISTVLNALYYVPSIIVVFSNAKKDKLTFNPSWKDGWFFFAMISFIIINFYVGLNSGPIVDAITQGLRTFG